MEYLFPGRRALAEKHLVSAARRPIFAVDRTNSTRIFFNPGNGVRTRLDTGSDVQLQHHPFSRVFRNQLDGSYAVDRRDLPFVSVIPGLEIVRSELLSCLLQ